jgi:(p)ppGpp synthase/HD superfamily hydrolase
VHLEADWEQDRIMQFAHCCLPVRGDKIVGILSPQGLSIHRENCAEIDSCGLKPEHLLAVNWDLLPKRKNFSARLHIYCVNRIGVLASISTTIARHDSNILGLLNTVSDDPTLDYLEMTISVDDLEHLESIISSLRDIRFVRVVQRV